MKNNYFVIFLMFGLLFFVSLFFLILILMSSEENSDNNLEENSNILSLDNTPIKEYILEGRLELVGLKLIDEVYESSYEGKSNFDINSLHSKSKYLRVYKDSSSGCNYILNYDSALTPLYNSNGEVEGCLNNSSNISTEDKKIEVLKLLKSYYPEKDNDELEYMLDNIFDYKNKSLDELKDVLNSLTGKNLKEDIQVN